MHKIDLFIDVPMEPIWVCLIAANFHLCQYNKNKQMRLSLSIQ